MKSTILFVLVSFIFTEIAFGQIELNSSGNVGIGSITPDSDYKLSISYGTGLSGDDIRAIYAVYTGSSNLASAIEGRAITSAGNGLGGDFFGGYIGLRGSANQNITGSGVRRGLQGEASGGQFNLGVYGLATGTAANGKNYGIYGSAVGSGILYAGYFSGDLRYTGTLIPPSDQKLKEGITSLDGSSTLAKIMQLRPTSYTFIRTGDFASMNLPEGMQYGLVAQEVETIFPEIVHENTHPGPVDENGTAFDNPIEYKGVEYMKLIPILLKAIQEQQAEIDALKGALSANGIQINR